MDKLFKLITACLLTLAFVCAPALAGTVAKAIDGELGLKLQGYDDDSLLYRLNEYRTLPEDGVVSRLRLEYLCPRTGSTVRLFATDVGEDDVKELFYASYRDDLTFALDYEKTPHLINLGSHYFTERMAETYKLNILPLSKVHGSLLWGVEDKVGRASSANYVGQKNEKRAVELVGNAGIANILLGFADEELNERYRAHGSDEITASVNLAPSVKTFGIFSYEKKDYDLAMTTMSSSIEQENTELSTLFTLNKNLYVSSVFSRQDRSNSTGGAISYEDRYFSTTLGYRNRFGKFGLTYKNVDRDYTGADIADRDNRSLQLKGSTRWSFIGFKLDYVHGYKDSSGITNSNLIDFEELNTEYGKTSLTFSLLDFKKFAFNFHLKRDYRKHSPHASYGTSENVSTNNGFTSHYMAEENLIFFLNYYELKNIMQGRQKFWRLDSGTGLMANIDTTFEIYDDTNYFQIGGVYSYTAATDIILDFYSANSKLLDPQDSNRIRERVLTLKVEHEISKTNAVNSGITLNSYEETLGPEFSSANTLYEVEFARKF
ncbi:MAG: hypothetical protein ABIH66_04935 [bacterium]